ncbi:type I-E CRISPR-associated protein Cse1/CasA [Kitasatospora cineracea]|uniref:type I-E CRISPR-associated protein Cse1/CasA n=1 Tax=Kitasatospora cineracea TaxID=88074 RepID=UPI0036911284
MPTHDRTQVPDKSTTFDLTEQAWIPVLLTDGRESELSLREVFEQATRIRRLACELPTQEFALTRLLLAIAHDALDDPGDIEEWADLWEDPQALLPVLPYLQQHQERFDLLHPRTPFFQCAQLRTGKDEVFPLNRIVADVPNGNPFFTARFPGVDRIGFAEAARWVVHAHAYDTSGIKTGVEGDPRAKAGKAYPQGPAWAGHLGGLLAEGADLRESLLLNLIATDQWKTRRTDLPAWRRPPAGPGAADDLASRPTGPRDLYTWQSRRIRLHADHDGVHGVVLSYGDPLTPQNRFDTEPMTAWRRSQAQEKKLGRVPVYMPREVDPTRAAWRGLGSLIAAAAPEQGPASEAAPALRPELVHWLARLETERILPRGYLVRLRTFGAVYGTQQSVVDEITSDTLAFALVVLSERDTRLGQAARDAASDADLAVRALGDLASDLARAAGSESETPRASARDAGFGALDGPYRRWLAAIRDGDQPTTLRTDWQQQAREIVSGLGSDLISQAGEAAWQGRMVATKQGEAWLNTSSADLWFRSRLKRALPLAFPDIPQPEPQDSSSGPLATDPTGTPDASEPGTAPHLERATA